MRLQLTRRADYAIRAIICLATEGRGGPIPVATIAQRMEVPRGFLPQIMQDLVQAGLVEGTPGRGGGYRLTRAPGGISLLEVIEAIEGDARRRTCVLTSTNCDVMRPCSVHDLFASAQDALLERLADATILDATQDGAGTATASGPLEA